MTYKKYLVGFVPINSLNIEKSNYVIFRSPQKLVNHSINRKIGHFTVVCLVTWP